MTKEKFSADKRWLYSLLPVLVTWCSCVFVLPTANSQQPTAKYRLLHVIPGQFKTFTTDKLHNVYLISAKNEVLKFGPEGQGQFRYANTTLGEPAVLDAFNPFQLLLFFQEHQTVQMLDRTLSEFGRFNLFQMGLVQTSIVAMSSDNQLWVYDESNFKLKKISDGGEVILESSDLSLVLEKAPRPNFLMERNREVFLNDPETGILLFDLFGKYLKTLPIPGLKEFQVIEDQLFYFQNGKLFSFHLQSLLEKPVLLPEEIQPENKVRVESNRLYVLGSDELKVF